MTSVILSVIFLLGAADQQTTSVAAEQPAPAAATTTATPAAEPKLVCKYEHVTGSRLSKQKVCRAEGAEGDADSTALQRQLDRASNVAQQAPLMGN